MIKDKENIKRMMGEVNDKKIKMSEFSRFAEMVGEDIKSTDKKLDFIDKNLKNLHEDASKLEEKVDNNHIYVKEEINSLEGSFENHKNDMKSLCDGMYKNIEELKSTEQPEILDKEEIINEVISRIELPEVKEFVPDDGLSIIDKINAIDSTSDDDKIDAKHIKNLPESKYPNIISNSNKYLGQMLDVDLSNVTQDSNGRYVLGTGGATTKSIAFINLSSNQNSNIANGNHIEYDSIVFQKGNDISLSTGSGQSNGIVTLPAGKTFKITANCSIRFGGNTGTVGILIKNITAGTYLNYGGKYQTPNFAAQSEFITMAPVGFITTTVSTNIHVEIESPVSLIRVNGTVGAGSTITTTLLIEEI